MISNFKHPLIKEMFIKKTSCHETLVIETQDQVAGRNFIGNSSLTDLLTDLPTLQHKIEEKFGHFDQVDIRTH